MKKFFILSAIVFGCTFTQSVKAQDLSSLGNIGNIIGNVISSVTGDMTTTKESLIGEWSYTQPAVQFESENLLTKAGGAATAAKVEEKLATYYKLVGITEGTLKFSFAEDGTCTYGVGSKSLKGTYTFDADAKTVSIKIATGQTVKAYVTVSINTMSLCFDSTKMLTLFNSISSKFSKLQTLNAVTKNYEGMKVGFKLSKK